MNWFLARVSDLFTWLWRRVYRAFEWLLDSLGSALTWLCNHVQAVAVALVASLGGVMPSESLSDTWQDIILSVDWLTPWAQWFSVNCISLPDFFARASYLALVVAGAYVVRGAFMAVRALLDLL